jgi:hypothetical protein
MIIIIITGSCWLGFLYTPETCEPAVHITADCFGTSSEEGARMTLSVVVHSNFTMI